MYTDWKNCIPHKYKHNMHQQRWSHNTFKEQTGFTLETHLDSVQNHQETKLINWGDGYYVQVEVHPDEDAWLDDLDYGKIETSREWNYEGHVPVNPSDTQYECYYIGEYGWDHHWLYPNYPFEERVETLRRYGVAKHDARLIARDACEAEASRVRSFYRGHAWYAFQETTVWYSDNHKLGEDDLGHPSLVEVDSDSCGFIEVYTWNNDGYDHLESVVRDSIYMIIKHDKPIRAAMKRATQAAKEYAYA